MSDRDRVLRLLRQRGPEGFGAVEFLSPEHIDHGKVIVRVAARVCELRRLGHHIKTFTEANGTARYVLVREAAPGLVATAAGRSSADDVSLSSAAAPPPAIHPVGGGAPLVLFGVGA